MNTPESFEKKLFIPRDAEGNPNTEALQEVREIEGRLEAHQAFVGVQIFGSTLGGYSIESSDLDIKILYDAAESESEIEGQLATIMNSVIAETLNDPSRKQVRYRTSNINIDLMISDLESNNPAGIITASDLFFKVAGKRIENYRQRFADFVRTLPQEERARIEEQILNEIMSRELEKLPKLEERIPEARANRETWLRARMALWAKRIEQLLSGN
jgi:predicted nucleotidyltransferase